MRPKRIAKSKGHLLGCVIEGEVGQTLDFGGFVRVKTTACKGMWLAVPKSRFRIWADSLRPYKQRYINHYTTADANRVIAWLRAKMICFVYEVSQGPEGELIYSGHVIGLMEGEENVS